MTHWIWEEAGFPNFIFNNQSVSVSLGKARQRQGQLLALINAIDSDNSTQLAYDVLSEEMIATSAIEGEVLNRDSVRSSIANRLNIETGGISHKQDRHIEGLLDIMLDATLNYSQPLTLERLCSWHAALFPIGYSGIKKIDVATLRGNEQMKIISGYPGKEKVHYIAPPGEALPKQVNDFLEWFNADESKQQTDGLLRAAITHLWFEILHPFDDGNGRIGRALIELVLAEDEQNEKRYYSLSKKILKQRKDYYRVLESTSRGTIDITEWIIWFLDCFISAIDDSIDLIDVVLEKMRFWQAHIETPLNERQRKVLNRMLQDGIRGFEGGITTKKYMHITKTSRATAYRELHDLVKKKCLSKLPAKGRSSAYEIRN